MNNNIKANVNAATNSVVEKYTNNVIIRMSDFYPEAVGGQEYCMVTKEVYAELLRFKAIEEEAETEIITPENMPTVIIMVTDFYPETKGGEEYREISREEFDKLIRKMEEKEKKSEPAELGTTEKIVVRTRDFYPFLCSEKEYTELDRHTYELLLKFKASGEYEGNIVTPFSTPTTSVKVNVKSYFPDADIEDNDVSIEIYEELLRYKELENEYRQAAKSDTVRIRVADFYPDNCCEAEYCDVSREVYEQLMSNKRADHAGRVKDSRYMANFCFDEVQCGEEEKIYTQSNARDILISMWLKSILYSRSPLLYRRAVMYFVKGYKIATIAMLDGVSRQSVYQAIKTITGMLKEHKEELAALM